MIGAWEVVRIRLNQILHFCESFRSSSTDVGVGVAVCEHDSPKSVASVHVLKNPPSSSWHCLLSWVTLTFLLLPVFGVDKLKRKCILPTPYSFGVMLSIVGEQEDLEVPQKQGNLWAAHRVPKIDGSKVPSTPGFFSWFGEVEEKAEGCLAAPYLHLRH